MRTIKSLFVAILTLILCTTTFAQTADHSKKVVTKTETIKISGNCETCKALIEKTAKVNGVTKAEWSINTKVLTLIYNPAKVTPDAIQKKIAAVGYDTPKYKASTKVYNALPGCCKYR